MTIALWSSVILVVCDSLFHVPSFSYGFLSFFYVDLPGRYSYILYCCILYLGFPAGCKRSSWGGKYLIDKFILIWIMIVVFISQYPCFFVFSNHYWNFDLQIRSLDAIQKRFERFPAAFMDTLHVHLDKRCFHPLIFLLFVCRSLNQFTSVCLLYLNLIAIL